MDGALGKPKHRSMVRTGDVWMFEHETYLEKKWLEGHGIREDSIHLRETYRRVKDKQSGKYRSSKGIMNKLLEDVSMDYMMHLKFAWILALKLFLLSLISLVHGMLPFIFSSTVSNGVKALDLELESMNRK